MNKHPRRLPTRLPHFLVALLLLTLGGESALRAEDGQPEREYADRYKRILVIDFEGPIEGVMAAYMKRRLEKAEEGNYDCVVLRIESPGGTVFHSEEISQRVFALPESIHTVAWVPRQALSGACMVAMACREIVLSRAGTLGDCQPIVMDPSSQSIKPVGEKIESPLRAIFRQFAQANGHPEALSEAFVSEHLEVIKVRDERDDRTRYIDGEWFKNASPEDELADGTPRSALRSIGPPIVGEGELLTVTGEEAIRFGFMRRVFPDQFPKDEDELLAVLGTDDATVDTVRMSFSEEMSKILLGFAGILASLVALALILFLTQGPGIMTFVGVGALTLLLLINVTAEQINGFPIFLIMLGAILIIVELFIIPGTGIFGIVGFAAFGGGFLLLVTGSSIGDTERRLTHDAVTSFGIQFVATALVGIGAIIVASKYFPQVGPGRRLMLAAPQGGITSAVPAPTVPVGSRGTAASDLRPAGSALFDGTHVDVVSDGRFVAQGTPVTVVGIEGAQVMVAPLDGEAAS
jgi:membrane-bound serine protease (ClpP class)